MNEHLSPTIAKLRSFPQNRNRRPQAKGLAPQPKLTRALAERFCNLIAETDKSLFSLIEQNPWLPHHKTLFNWQQRVPWFHDMWKQARIRQTLFLAQVCLNLAQQACPKTAHVVRVKFDIYKWYMAKYNPELFGDKPAQQPQQTTVNLGISISPERLQDIRSKLDSTRSVFIHASKRESASSTHRKELTNGNGNADRKAQPETNSEPAT